MSSAPSTAAEPNVVNCKVKALGPKHSTYLTLLLHIHTMHKGRRGAHKQAAQLSLIYICTIRKEKQARNHFNRVKTALSTHFSSSPAATLPVPSSSPWVGNCWGSHVWGTAHPAWGSWAHTINISTFVQLLHHKTSAFIILSYQLTQSKLARNILCRLPLCWLSRSSMPTEGSLGWDIQFSTGFASS